MPQGLARPDARKRPACRRLSLSKARLDALVEEATTDAYNEGEFHALHEDVRTEILALSIVLEQFGPQLGRPRVDTLKGSRHANMKELRFSAADGEWRVVFAFDRRRKAILLVAGDKSGGSEKRFYRELIRKADERFDAHLARIGKGT